MWVEEEEALAVEEEVEAHDKPLRFGNRWVYYGIKEGSNSLCPFLFYMYVTVDVFLLL